MYNHVKPCVLLCLRVTTHGNLLNVVDLVVVCMYVCMYVTRLILGNCRILRRRGNDNPMYGGQAKASPLTGLTA
jgi:hypothetical protein